MTVTATEVFAFLDSHPILTIERREVSSTYFGAVRRNLRVIIGRLAEAGDDDALALCQELWTLLFTWLTVPARFENLKRSLEILGESNEVEFRWGRDVRMAYEEVLEAAELVQLDENPIRDELRTVFQNLQAHGKSFRIHCHTQARAHFESIMDSTGSLSADCFLRSVAEYREAHPFDVLVKVGPLRSRGWGTVPDALLSAPRFQVLLQVVWSGCADEPNFGYDPVPYSDGTQATGHGVTGRELWTRHAVYVGDDPGDTSGVGAADDLSPPQGAQPPAQRHRAILLQLDQGLGVLFPPLSQVPSFDSQAKGNGAVSYRLAKDMSSPGMFFVGFVGEADFGGIRAGEGPFSRLWKRRLEAELTSDARGLTARLRNAGLDLQNLSFSVKQWMRPATTVIHAPQQRRHFEILIDVLGIRYEPFAPSNVRRQPWSWHAWREIGHSRGEAIQHGIEGHEVTHELLFEILNELVPEIRERATADEVFDLDIPSGQTLEGSVRFWPVRATREGFTVPDTELKTICGLDLIEQWRV